MTGTFFIASIENAVVIQKKGRKMTANHITNITFYSYIKRDQV